MKILKVNTNDINGGAAIAAYRLLKGLQEYNIEAEMLVQHKKSDDYSVIGPRTKYQKAISKVRPIIDNIPLKFYKNRKKVIFSPAFFSDNISKKIKKINPDLVHLHWIAGGFLRIESLSNINKPIIWTLHDMWAFTGGCHYSQNCEKYLKNCGNCPILNSGKEKDLSYRIWRRKKNTYQKLNLTVVTPSSWLADCARKSFLLFEKRVEVIPNGLNLEVFKPIDKFVARKILNLPKNKKLILFGAINALDDKRKGFFLLKEAFHKLFLNKKDYEIGIFGCSEPKNKEYSGFKTHYLGKLSDEVALALAYSAFDVMIVPSIQEAFGQTASESLACGTTVVAFNATGLKDIVDHKINGYLATPFDPSDLSNGIEWALDDENRLRELGHKAREKAVKCYDINKVAKKYINLYQNILEECESS